MATELAPLLTCGRPAVPEGPGFTRTRVRRFRLAANRRQPLLVLPVTVAGGPGEHPFEFGRVHRLEEVQVDACFPAPRHVGLPPVAGDGHEQGLLQARQQPDAARHLVAVHAVP
jgi:hypothetical protein